jgi:SAM-dependent methyltransferase
MNYIRFQRRDDVPVQPEGICVSDAARELIALDIKTKYVFTDEDGHIHHEYEIPGSADIQFCGGYIDKIVKYRDPDLLQYLRDNGISKQSLDSDAFPILRTRSPQLDAILVELIGKVRGHNGGQRVSLFDHGCSAAEHFDLLDVMLTATYGERAAGLLSYCGLDRAALLLSAARLLHPENEAPHFRLTLSEGSRLDFPDDSFDLSLSVGVVNHVADPRATLRHLIRSTKHAAVLALWVTADETGFYSVNHAGAPFYFFSRNDLIAAQEEAAGGHFLIADFIPEYQSSQRRSYLGITEEQEAGLGCYHTIFDKVGFGLPYPSLAVSA